jgi:hypothetical protein
MYSPAFPAKAPTKTPNIKGKQMTSPKVKDHQAAARRRRLILAGVRLKYTKPPSVDVFDEEMFKRLNSAYELAMKSPQPPMWLFINPIAVISCVHLSPVFFEEVRRVQAEWCRRSKSQFPRFVRKSVKNWDPNEPDLTKQARYRRRCLFRTGLMFHAGQETPHHEWKEFEAEATKAALKTTMTTIEPQPEMPPAAPSNYPETVPIPPPPIVPANSAR